MKIATLYKRWYLVIGLLISLSTFSHASDHASPLDPPEIWLEEARLSDLFFWPDQQGNYNLALALFPRVNSATKADFSRITYSIYWDTTSEVTFESDFNNLLFGGTIRHGKKIKANYQLSFELNNDFSLKSLSSETLAISSIESFVGLRADPFIFPAVKNNNVVMFIAKIPQSAISLNDKTTLVWANATVDKHHPHQADHVGRFSRSQQTRLDKLNFLPPELHLEWLETQPKFNSANPNGVRWYDYQADVLIYNANIPAAYPNGRTPDDDPIPILCKASLCRLYERSVLLGGWPRRTASFKPPSKVFPYFAEPF